MTFPSLARRGTAAIPSTVGNGNGMDINTLRSRSHWGGAVFPFLRIQPLGGPLCDWHA
jgi:hypothetical protein